MGMRVLHVNKFLYRRGGAENYLFDLIARQRAAGDEVAVWGMAHEDAPEQRYQDLLAPFVELEPPPRGLVPRARAAARTLWSETSRRRLLTVLRDFRPDVAHVHNIYHHLSPSVLHALKSQGVATVMTLHDYKLVCPSYHLLVGDELCTRCLDGRFRHAVETSCKGSRTSSAVVAAEARVHRSLRLYHPVDRFLSPSHFLADTLRSAGVFSDRIDVIGFPIDVPDLRVKQQPGGPLFYGGRLSREKGVDILLAAVGSIPHARLEVVGDGPERAALERLADAVAPERVTFHGQLERPALLSLMRSSTAAVVPSRWYENMPLSVLESLASGVPVVASHLGGLPELVTPEVDGLLVPHADPIALARALRRVLADPQRALEMGQAGRAKAEVAFDPDRHLEHLHETYLRVRAAAA